MKGRLHVILLQAVLFQVLFISTSFTSKNKRKIEWLDTAITKEKVKRKHSQKENFSCNYG